jgi:hypothetical protein
MIPTVAAFRPDKREYTGGGKVSPIRETPKESTYMPVAPGRLFLGIRKGSHVSLFKGSRLKLTYHHRAKEPNPARRPP